MLGIKSFFPYLMASLLYMLPNIKIFSNNTLDYFLQFIPILMLLAIFILFALTLFSDKKQPIVYLGKNFLSVFYLAIPFTLMTRIPFVGHEYRYESILILGLFILIWVNDSFAYLVGVKFGKNKLLERISPKKTIEGFVGGFVFTFIAAYILSVYFNNLTFINWMFFAGIVSIFGVTGDLIESMFKRKTGVKDSSNFIPGHGGFLDRLDSIIFTAPFIFTYLLVINL
jgi:phosphatidate cytidylyltransferase